LGGLFGGGGEAAAGAAEAGAAEAGVAGAAETAGVVGGMEAAGLGLDATGVGLPLGLAVGALGLGLGFHKQIGHFIGGLFGHKKKSSDTGAAGATGDPATDDMLTLLSAKPPKGSLIELLTSPAPSGGGMMGVGGPAQHKKHKGLFGSIGDIASGMMKGLPVIGSGFAAMQSLMTGGGISGALGAAVNSMINPFAGLSQVMSGVGGLGSSLGAFFGGGAASAQTLAAPYQWGATPGGTPYAVDLASMAQLYAKGGGGTGTGQTSGTGSGGSGGTGSGGSGGSASAGSNAANQALGQSMAAGAPWNWTGDEWVALNKVAMAESGWSMTAKNPTSDAYGIAQGITGPSWYYQYGGDPNTAKGQITGFLNYIKQRYGKPSAAWAHEQSSHWYARGSQLIDRTQLAVLHKGEAVIPAQDNYSTHPYNRNGAMGGGGGVVHLNCRPGSIVLQVSNNPTQSEMDNVAKQFVQAISKPQILAAARSQ